MQDADPIMERAALCGDPEPEKKQNQFTLGDHLHTARSLIYVVNENVCHAETASLKTKLKYKLVNAKLLLLLEMLEEVRDEIGPEIMGLPGGSLPPGRDNAVSKFYRAVLEGFDGRAVHLGASSLHVGSISKNQDKPVKKKMRRVKKCGQCEQLRINGIVCHEHGCPNSGRAEKDWR